MRRVFFMAFLFCFIQAYAKSPQIPEALLNAKTALVVNSGAEVKDYERLCKLLKEWGRFEIVQDPNSANIIIRINAQLQNRTVQTAHVGGSGINTIQVLINYLRISDVRDDTLLWSDETPTESKDPRILVDKLKNKMKKK